ncbi:hypothetical protein QE152_g4528 [Popillia japonica]|uniref:C2H2-type domain-containing protein n=1 Tax=Popillia japonica TaxID=7064 RepID=A0AAW1MYT5_POPJA
MFKKPEKAEVTPNKIPDLIPAAMSQKFGDLKQKNNASFFDKFKAKLTTNKLTCELCGHESKCLTESVAHQKSCGKEPAQIQYINPVHTVSSTRCQFCRQRCKSSTDLLNHLQTCREALKQIKNEKDDNGGVKIESELSENEPHPMENRVFVWNNIEVPLDIEMESAEESQYEYVHETNKQDDNVSLDLSIRTHSPSSESSFVVNQEIQQNSSPSVSEKIPTHGNSESSFVVNQEIQQNSSPSVSEKIPTHGNDISVAQHKRVFKCPHCTFWASTASRFHVHIVGHLNRKPFECSLCSYRSNWRWDITKHIKLKSVRDPNHESAKVLMTDETGRRNYTKYNKYLTEINLSGEHNETCGGFGTRTKNHDPPSQVPLPNKTELPKLTRAPSSNDFRPLLRNQRPPPGLKAADEMFLAKLANEKKKNNADSKKTMWKCKKCNFRDASREKLLVHVRDHYPPRNVNEMSGNSSASQDIDERHCRLKHSGDIRVVIGTRSASEKMEIDDQIEEQDHVDLPQTGTFKCKQCPFSNNDNDIFEQHLEGHSASTDRHHQCSLCLYNAHHRDDLMEHLKLHGIPDPEEYLGRREKTSLDLEISKRYKCTECPYVTNSKSQFSYHKQFHKPKRGEYTCSTCGYNVSKRHLLHQHLKVHGFNPSSQKQNGDIIDLEEASDEIEEIIQSGNSSVDLQSCPDVPLVWVSKNGKFSKMYKCRYCPHVNLRKINIQEHEKMHGTREKNPNSVRLNDTEHKCPDCNYVCNNAGVLSSHSKVHQGLYGKIHGMVDLTKSDEEQISELSQFAVYHPSMDCVGFEEEDDGELSGELAQEPMEVSSDSVVYFCDKCPARFLKENEFYIHLRFHGARLIYKCNYCSYTARQKPHVLAHKNVHTEQYQERTKLFKETYCSHPDYPPPSVHAMNDSENGTTVYVVSEDDKSSLLEAEEPDSSFTPNKSTKSTFTVPLSGTELFQQKNQAQQNQRSSEMAEIEPTPSISMPIDDEPPFGGVMQGNPDFNANRR